MSTNAFKPGILLAATAFFLLLGLACAASNSGPLQISTPPSEPTDAPTSTPTPTPTLQPTPAFTPAPVSTISVTASPEELLELGVALEDAGLIEDALAHYDQAVRLDPLFALAFFNRGVVYANLADYQQAIADYDEAIRLDPQYAPAFFNRGVVYGNLGQPQSAIQDYGEAMAGPPRWSRLR